MTRVAWLMMAAALLGCGDKELVVESDTSWRGSIERYGEVEGRGNARFDIGHLRDEVCWVFVKQATHGTLRVYADDKTWFTLGSEIDGDASTTAPNGRVQGCAR